MQITERFSTGKGIDVVYENANEWFKNAGISIAESDRSEGSFILRGEKKYRSPIVYRWKLANILFFIGFLAAFVRDRSINSALDLTIVFLPIVAYSAYYFFMARPKLAEFTVEGASNSAGGSDLTLKLSHDVEDAAEELTEFINSFTS